MKTAELPPMVMNTKAPVRAIAGYLFIGIVAFVVRVMNLGTFVTHDEVEFWFRRSESLLLAFQSGNFASMEISTHPGVTTMWLGSIGILLRRLLFEQGLLHQETFPVMVMLYRLPVVCVHSAAILLGYHLMRRLFPAAVAFLAACLWVADPFVVGYSRLLHVDGLMGTFATLSLLAACGYWNHGFSSKWLLVSSGCAGLAFLSKSPALILVPVVWGLAIAGAKGMGPRFLPLSFLMWLGMSVAVVVAAWPALWVGPVRVYEALRVGVEVEGGQPHMTGNFFLGQDDPSPGVLFYPVALALRTTPLSLVGLLLLPWAARAQCKAQSAKRRAQSERAQSAQCKAQSAERKACERANAIGNTHWRDVAMLASFIILFTCAMTLFPKKFNRYLVPVFPSVDILAAFGLVWGISLFSRGRGAAERIVPPSPLGRRGQGVEGLSNASDAKANVHDLPLCGWGRGLLMIIALVNVLWWHPYELTAFNQWLGGGQAGAHTFAVGWGEGFEQVAAWLNQQPDITDVLTISTMITSFDPYLRKGARATFPKEGNLKKGTGYVVVYIYQVQGGQPPPPFDQFYHRVTPLHTVSIHGVEYAWIYDVPRRTIHVVGADFGEKIHLYGFDQDKSRQAHALHVILAWQARVPCENDYWLFAHLIGSDGQRYGHIDQPYQTSTWQPGRVVSTELVMDIPQDIPAGGYQLVIGLYDAQNGQRLPLSGAVPYDSSIAGPHALLLHQVQ